MKNFLLYLFLLKCIVIEAQSTKDSTHHCLKITDNRYGLFHRTIKDTATKTVSKFGHYFSIGTGFQRDAGFSGFAPKCIFGSEDYHSSGFALISSYSLAYKSHLVSITESLSRAGGYNSAETGYRARYLGVLIGESIRFKYFMGSISAGVAYSNILVVKTLSGYGSYAIVDKDGFVSIPIEFKAFLLARNGIGIGVHLTENLCSPSKYSPFTACICLVTGFWNRPKHKK